MRKVLENRIEAMIYVVNGKKVMLDSDLAELYEVTTGNFNKAVKRNSERFPKDFMFKLSDKDFRLLKKSNDYWGGRRSAPLVFTECGIAMLSGVLNSKRAIEVNIAIMRTFIKMRVFLADHESLSDKVNSLEKGSNELFKIIFTRLDSIENDLPVLNPKRKKVGI